MKAVPDILYTIPIFCSHFLVIFRTMKYSRAENEIVIESARHPSEMCNEISRATLKDHNEIPRATSENSPIKCCGYLLKNRNEIPRDTFEKPQ